MPRDRNAFPSRPHPANPPPHICCRHVTHRFALRELQRGPARGHRLEPRQKLIRDEPRPLRVRMLEILATEIELVGPQVDYEMKSGKRTHPAATSGRTFRRRVGLLWICTGYSLVSELGSGLRELTASLIAWVLSSELRRQRPAVVAASDRRPMALRVVASGYRLASKTNSVQCCLSPAACARRPSDQT